MYIGCAKAERIRLQCSDNTAPEIESATWGCQDEAVCPHPTKDDMSTSADVTESVKNFCNEKRCAFRANKRQFGDLCDNDAGTLIIKIEYKCPTEPPTPICKYHTLVLNYFSGLFLIRNFGTTISYIFMKY